MTDRFDRPARPYSSSCPIAPFECASAGYAQKVDMWLANPHDYFKSFGEMAHRFQMRHRSERLRTMTFVVDPEQLVPLTPVKLYLGRDVTPVKGWDGTFSAAIGELGMAYPRTFDALQRHGLLEWLDCPAGGMAFSAMLMSGGLKPSFDSWEQVIYRIQWLVLMCGIKLNEAIVQVNPYTDEEWLVRQAEIQQKRRDERAYMAGRRSAQEAWAAAHPREAADFAARADEHGRYVPPSYMDADRRDGGDSPRPPRRDSGAPVW